MAGKDSEKLIFLQSEVARLKSDNLMLQKVYKESETTAEQSNEDIKDSENFDDSENRNLDAPENILKYITLIEEANKVMHGYYEGCEITQAKYFYNEVLGVEDKFKFWIISFGK